MESAPLSAFQMPKLTYVWQALDLVFPGRNVHNRYSRHFSDPPLQVSVTSCHDVTFVLGNRK